MLHGSEIDFKDIMNTYGSFSLEYSVPENGHSDSPFMFSRIFFLFDTSHNIHVIINYYQFRGIDDMQAHSSEKKAIFQFVLVFCPA